MSYVDYSSQFVLDQFLTYLNANQLGSNDQHLYDTFAVEHNINTSTIDGTHKTNSITGSMINTTPASTGSQAIAFGATWTPSVGVYQIVIGGWGGIPDGAVYLQLFISGSWRGLGNPITSIMFFDGTNMRLSNNDSEDTATVYYQKF